MSRDISVGTETRLRTRRLGVRLPVGTRELFLLHDVQTDNFAFFYLLLTSRGGYLDIRMLPPFKWHTRKTADGFGSFFSICSIVQYRNIPSVSASEITLLLFYSINTSNFILKAIFIAQIICILMAFQCFHKGFSYEKLSKYWHFLPVIYEYACYSWTISKSKVKKVKLSL
jgi:hypothetical protein